MADASATVIIVGMVEHAEFNGKTAQVVRQNFDGRCDLRLADGTELRWVKPCHFQRPDQALRQEGHLAGPAAADLRGETAGGRPHFLELQRPERSLRENVEAPDAAAARRHADRCEDADEQDHHAERRGLGPHRQHQGVTTMDGLDIADEDEQKEVEPPTKFTKEDIDDQVEQVVRRIVDSPWAPTTRG